MLACYLVMSLLPFAVINLRRPRKALRLLAARELVGGRPHPDIFACLADRDVERDDRNAVDHGRRPLHGETAVLRRSFSVSPGRGSRACFRTAQEQRPIPINEVQSHGRGLQVERPAPEHMSTYQVKPDDGDCRRFGQDPEKNIGPRSSSSQGICECSRLAVQRTAVLEKKAWRASWRSRSTAYGQGICDIWTVPGALAEAEALDAFEETHYARAAVEGRHRGY